MVDVGTQGMTATDAGERGTLGRAVVAYRLRNREWLHRVKEAIGCQECGEAEPECLRFHHLYEANRAKTNPNGNGVQALADEYAKCIVLCLNCHQKVHRGKLDPVKHDGERIDLLAHIGLREDASAYHKGNNRLLR